MKLPQDWKAYALGVIAAGVVTVAGNWSSSRIDVLEHTARALESNDAEQEKALKTMIATLARLEQKIDDMRARVGRVETKIDDAPKRRAR